MYACAVTAAEIVAGGGDVADAGRAGEAGVDGAEDEDGKEKKEEGPEGHLNIMGMGGLFWNRIERINYNTIDHITPASTAPSPLRYHLPSSFLRSSPPPSCSLAVSSSSYPLSSSPPSP